jgi:hypothetical protein
VRAFQVETVAQTEFEMAAAFYERRRDGLGLEFVDEVQRVLHRIAQRPSFPTVPIAQLERGVVRREFVERFPYVVVFVETNELRKVIMIRRGSSSPARWRSRI